MKEKEIEHAILRFLNSQEDFFAFKFKDQAKRVNGYYKKDPWQINGVADICLLKKDAGIVWIEVKTEKGRQSQGQVNFQAKLASLGHKYLIVRGVEDCKNQLGL
jgi:hypothetical protein